MNGETGVMSLEATLRACRLADRVLLHSGILAPFPPRKPHNSKEAAHLGPYIMGPQVPFFADCKNRAHFVWLGSKTGELSLARLGCCLGLFLKCYHRMGIS